MKWRIRWALVNFLRRFTIYNVLVKDQCRHGFAHTQQALLSWLAGCDLEAQESLHKALGEQIEEIRVFRR